ARDHRRGHRTADRGNLRRLAARPLVHHRAGTRLRLHRPHRRQPRPGCARTHPRARAPLDNGSARMSTYTIPNVITRGAGGERIMDVYSHLLSERVLYLGTAIDSGVANALIAQLLFLEADNPEQEINLYINSEG